jgi:cobalt-zinc-cadmium efflux system protein
LSLLVAGLIVWWAFGLLQEALHVLLEGKPAKVDCAEIARSLRREFPAIQDIHELRVWVLTSQCLCCSAHVLLEDMALSEGTRLRGQIERSLRHRFHVQHAMILIESRGVP